MNETTPEPLSAILAEMGELAHGFADGEVCATARKVRQWVSRIEAATERERGRTIYAGRNGEMTLDECITRCDNNSGDNPRGRDVAQIGGWLRELRERRCAAANTVTMHQALERILAIEGYGAPWLAAKCIAQKALEGEQYTPPLAKETAKIEQPGNTSAKWLYRLEYHDGTCGLWYDGSGNWCFERGIGSLDDSCKTKSLPMDYDERYRQDGRSWFSSCSRKEDLLHWYSREDAKRLLSHGFVFTRYLATEYREYDQQTVFIKETCLYREEIDFESLWKSSSPGSTSALREALEFVAHMNDSPYTTYDVLVAVQKARAALAAPARNCDRTKHDAENLFKRRFGRPWTETEDELAAWLFAPMNENGGNKQ